MVQFKHQWNITGKTVESVKNTARKLAKGIGMTANNIRAEKTTMRSGGIPVYKVSATLKERKRKKKG